MSNKRVITGSGDLVAVNASISGSGKVEHTSVSANLVAGAASISGTGAVTKAVDAIGKSELMPRDARDAIIDGIKESFNDHLWNTIEELTDILPDLLTGLMDYYEIILKILQSLI